MSSRFLLRLEGALVLIAAAGVYAATDLSWGLFAGLLLVPDIVLIGYGGGPRVGAAVYNAGHTYAVPLLLGGAALGLEHTPLGGVALIWAAHIGMDRALGYGLKHPTGFHDTHLSAPSRPSPGGTRPRAAGADGRRGPGGKTPGGARTAGPSPCSAGGGTVRPQAAVVNDEQART
ncbi:MAG: DUF4260 domain-containing protein [Salinibacter sp.]